MQLTKHFIIGYGLPGSGKTKWLTELYNVTTGIKKFVSLDDLYFENNPQKGVSAKLVYEYELRKVFHSLKSEEETCYIFVDILIYNQKSLIDFIKSIKSTMNEIRINHNNVMKLNEEDDIKLDIYFFEENKEACLWNDLNRRDLSCMEFIKSNNVEALPDEFIHTISNKHKLEIQVHTKVIVKKSIIDIVRAKYNAPGNNNIVKSEEWYAGGYSGGNCWGGKAERVEGDTPPDKSTFKDVLNIIDDIKPSLSYKHYAYILNNLVYEGFKGGDREYYGNSSNYGYYWADIEEIINYLIKC